MLALLYGNILHKDVSQSNSYQNKTQHMNYPEYLSLFSNAGEFEVAVKFKGDGFVPSRRATAGEIMHLLGLEAGKFRTAMTFDDHLCEIYKYRIDPVKNKVTLSVQKL